MLISKQQFPSKGRRQCAYSTAKSTLCWMDNELLRLDFNSNGISMQVLEFDWQPATFLFPLFAEQGILLVCGPLVCNASVLMEDELIHLTTYPLQS